MNVWNGASPKIHDITFFGIKLLKQFGMKISGKIVWRVPGTIICCGKKANIMLQLMLMMEINGGLTTGHNTNWRYSEHFIFFIIKLLSLFGSLERLINGMHCEYCNIDLNVKVWI